MRKAAARKPAEVAGSENEIKSATGHTTSRMVARYVKDAKKKRRAGAAIIKLQKRR